MAQDPRMMVSVGVKLQAHLGYRKEKDQHCTLLYATRSLFSNRFLTPIFSLLYLKHITRIGQPMRALKRATFNQRYHEKTGTEIEIQCDMQIQGTESRSAKK